MSPCTPCSRVITSCELNTSCAGTQFRSRASQSQGNFATSFYAELPNHATMTRGALWVSLRRSGTDCYYIGYPIYL